MDPDHTSGWKHPVGHTDPRNHYLEINQQVIEMGRKINFVIKNFNKFSRFQVEQFLDEISDLFKVYKNHESNYDNPYEDDFIYTSQKNILRDNRIKTSMHVYMILDKNRYSLYQILTFARTIFIQIYLFVNETNITYNNTEITFYETETDYLSGLIENINM